MVAQNGWLNLFMKDTELKRQNSNKMTKKKQMHFAKGSEDKTSSTSLNQLISADIAEQLKLVNIYSPDTNLLQLEPETLDPLVKKVFSELKFFKSLDCNKDFFDNFLFHLHEGYSLHDNPFHNFMHGVNGMIFVMLSYAYVFLDLLDFGQWKNSQPNQNLFDCFEWLVPWCWTYRKDQLFWDCLTFQKGSYIQWLISNFFIN